MRLHGIRKILSEYDGFDLSATNPQTIGQPESLWRTASGNADLKVTNWLQARLVADYSRRNIDNYYFSGPTQLPSTVYNSPRKLTRQGLTPEVMAWVRIGPPNRPLAASFSSMTSPIVPA